MRRHPQQARSQRRIEAILDSASRVIGERGFESATTNLIAAEANTSIGSIYQFFENKEAIVAALCDRYIHELTERMDSVEAWVEPCDGQISALLRTVGEYYWQNNGFRAFLFGTYAPSDMEMIQQRLLQPLTDHFSRVIKKHLPDMSDFEAGMHAEVILHVTSRLLYHANLQGGEQHAEALMQRQHQMVMYMCHAMTNDK